MMEHEITCDWIDRYNENELDETEKALFQELMLANPLLRNEVEIDACLNRFLGDAELLDLMKKISSVTKKKNRSGEPMHLLLIAACVLSLAVTGCIFYLIMSGTGTTNLSEMQDKKNVQSGNKNGTDDLHYSSEFQKHPYNNSRPVHKFKNLSLLTKNFEPLAQFELLIGSVTRSDQFILIKPNLDVCIAAGTEVPFAWRYADTTVILTLIILDNKGTMVAEIPLHPARSYTFMTKGFTEGLYYWKIMAADEMVRMGKLTIYQDVKI
jgi:hypothetical protein